MGRGGAATRGQGIPTGYAYRVQRATTKRSYAEFSAIDIKVFYCYLVLAPHPTRIAPSYLPPRGRLYCRPQADGRYSDRKRLIEQQDVSKPPSDEGGGFAEGELGGRDNATRQ